MLNWIAEIELFFDIESVYLFKTASFEIELFFENWNSVLMLNWIIWNRTIYMYKMNLTLNNLQWLICHKTKLNQAKPIILFP